MLSALLSPIMKYAFGGLLFLTLMLGIALHFERVHGRKQAARIEALTAKLEAISTRKNEQKTTTGTNIVTAKRKGEDADRVAKKIEAAPIAPGCKTPPEIMGADL